MHICGYLPGGVSIPRDLETDVVWMWVQEGCYEASCSISFAAWANRSIDIANHRGTITGSSSGRSLTGSTMISYGGIIVPNLGTVSFTTGPLSAAILRIVERSLPTALSRSGQRKQRRSQRRDLPGYVHFRHLDPGYTGQRHSQLRAEIRT